MLKQKKFLRKLYNIFVKGENKKQIPTLTEKEFWDKYLGEQIDNPKTNTENNRNKNKTTQNHTQKIYNTRRTSMDR